ncbi:MAG: hypothetical protein ACRCU1_16830, partial [Alsobacter sp.]
MDATGRPFTCLISPSVIKAGAAHSGRQRPVDYWINPRIKIAALWTSMLSRDRWAARISPALP